MRARASGRARRRGHARPANDALASAGSSRRLRNSQHDAIDPGVDIGHVHLKVSDIDRALEFYVGVLGFEEQARIGDQAAFISAGGYHHHIGLNTWESKGGRHRRRHHGALPLRHPLPKPRRARQGGQERRRRGHPHRALRPRRQRGCLPDATRMETASSSTGTGRRRSGREPRTAARWRCTRDPSTSRASSPKSKARALGGRLSPAKPGFRPA